MEKKVLQFIDSAGVYGAEQVILNLSNQMKNSEFQSVVGCIVNSFQDRNDLYDAARECGLEAIKIPISNAKVIFDLPQASKILSKNEISLIHSHGYKPTVFGSFLSRKLRIPIIATCHLWFEPDSGPLKMRAMIWLEKLLYRRFQKVIAVSESIKGELVQNGVAAKNVEIIKNGVSAELLAPCQQTMLSLRKELDISEEEIVLINTARLTRQKAQWSLIEAVLVLKERGVKVKLLIVGEGGLKDELSVLIQELNLEKEVQLLGFREDTDSLFSISDMFVLPSLDEGMPMSLLEAVACRLPVIATDVGDIGKLIKDKCSGVIIPIEAPEKIADAVGFISAHLDQAEEYSENALHELKRHYSSEAMASAYFEQYKGLV